MVTPTMNSRHCKAFITCPYCDWEDKDSEKFTKDKGRHTCGRCKNEFDIVNRVDLRDHVEWVHRQCQEHGIDVTKIPLLNYTTFRIQCQKKRDKHDYQSYSVGKTIKIGLVPETVPDFHRVMFCSKCGKRKSIGITKEEYLASS